jgi:hypothetical protein
MRRDLVIGVVAGLLVVAGGAFVVLRLVPDFAGNGSVGPGMVPAVGARPAVQPSSAGSTAPASAYHPGSTAGAVNPSAQSMPGNSTAPWLSSPNGTKPSALPAPGIAVGKQGAPTLESIQQRLQRISASGQPNAKELDAVLADLQRNQGSKVVAGVDLQALRENLVRNERIRELAEQIKIVAASPGPDTAKKLQPLMAEIQQQQAAMQPVGAPIGIPPPVGSAAAPAGTTAPSSSAGSATH